MLRSALITPTLVRALVALTGCTAATIVVHGDLFLGQSVYRVESRTHAVAVAEAIIAQAR